MHTTDTVHRKIIPEVKPHACDGLMYYRGEHYCQGSPNFVKNFKKLYKSGSLELLQNEDVFSDQLLDEHKSKLLMEAFVNAIAQMNTDDIEDITGDDTVKRKSAMLTLKASIRIGSGFNR